MSEVPVEELGPSVAVNLIRAVTPALEALNRTGVGVAHGALSASRIVVMEDGRLVVTEPVLGWALESLRFSRSQLNSLGIVVTDAAGPARFDGRTDVAQLGFLALSLRLQRHLDAADCPGKLRELLEESANIDGSTIAGARTGRWLERALQAGPEPFDSVQDAIDGLGDLPAATGPAAEDDAFSELADEGGAPVAPPAPPLPFPQPQTSVAPEPAAVVDIRDAASLSTADLRAALVRPHPVETQPLRRFSRAAAWVLGIVSLVAIAEGLTLVFMAFQPKLPAVVPRASIAADAPVLKPSPSPVDASAAPTPTAPPPTPTPAAASSTTDQPAKVVATPTPKATDGKTTPTDATARTGLVSLNATPWAEVIIDGRLVGETPIANLSLPAGQHVIVFRHPQLGERRQTIVVKPGALVRVAQAFRPGGRR